MATQPQQPFRIDGPDDRGDVWIDGRDEEGQRVRVFLGKFEQAGETMADWLAERDYE